MRRVEFGEDARKGLRSEWDSKVFASAPWTARPIAALALFVTLGLHAGLATGSLCRPSSLGSAPMLGERRGVVPSEREVESNMKFNRSMALVVVSATAPCSAAELLVPKQYPTIQAAIDAAFDGDTVRLAPGTFVESCVVQGKSISFVGSGAASTTWIAPPGARCLWMPFLDSKALVVSDIHFTGFEMSYNAAAVDLESTGAHLVSRCKFSASGYFALEVFGGGSIVEDCEFTANTGRGLSMTIPQGYSGATQTVRRCRFLDNANLFDQNASAIAIYNTSLRVEECQFGRNSWPSGSGRAIQVDSGQLVVAGSVFCESGSSPITGAWTDGGGNDFSSSPCVMPCAADLVSDRTVNAADMAIVLNFWGTNGSQFPGVDIDGDGIVNGSDLAAVLNAWGPCPQ